MSSPVPVRSAANHFWLSNGLARTAIVVLLATAVPVASLLWASGVARAEVEQRARAGLDSTAEATVLQEQQAWDDAVRVITSAASRPVPLSAIQSRDVTLAGLGARNILGTGPFSAVRIFDNEGKLVALEALPGVTVTPIGGTGTRAFSVGDPVGDRTGNFRQVAVPIGIGRARLVVDVDLTQLLGKPSDLAFGRTGAKFLVTPAGLIVAGSVAVGTELRSPINRSIAATGKPVTKVVFSPFLRQGNGRVLRADPRAEARDPRPAGADRGHGRRGRPVGALALGGGRRCPARYHPGRSARSLRASSWSPSRGHRAPAGGQRRRVPSAVGAVSRRDPRRGLRRRSRWPPRVRQPRG